MVFTFGKNWLNFIDKSLSAEMIEQAKTSLLKALKLETLKGKTFLDIGSGSGIHSLAAYHAGADSILSFDYDQQSVEATRRIYSFAGAPTNWKIMSGSVTDADFMKSLGKFDIAYSWGVLPFVGDINTAIQMAGQALTNSGVLFISLYSYLRYEISAFNDRHYNGNQPISPEKWLKIKEQYNKAGSITKRWMELKELYLRRLKKPRYSPLSWWNFYRYIKEYGHNRGMSAITDLRDWLGGWPMEFSNEAKVIQTANNHFNLRLLSMNTGAGLTEFFFTRKDSCCYWDDLSQNIQSFPISESYHKSNGYAYIFNLDEIPKWKDCQNNKDRPEPVLSEDGIPLYRYYGSPLVVEEIGKGTYVIDGQSLFFSTSDNTDPAGKNLTLAF